MVCDVKKTVLILLIGTVFLGACGESVALEKQTTESEICVYEQKFHKFDGRNMGPKVLIACTNDTSRGIK